MKRRNSCRGEPICKTPSRAAFFSAFLQLHALFNQCIHIRTNTIHVARTPAHSLAFLSFFPLFVLPWPRRAPRSLLRPSSSLALRPQRPSP